MARKTIQRDLHERKADHTKAYKVIGQRGQLRIEKAPEKVSIVSKKEEKEAEPEAAPVVEKETVKPEAAPMVEKAAPQEKVEEAPVITEEAPVVEEVVEEKPESKAKKPVAKKVSKTTPKTTKKGGRPRKAAAPKKEAEVKETAPVQEP